MMSLIFVALMQAAAGEPAPAPQETSPAPVTEPAAPAAAPADTQERSDRHRRRCRVQTVTGSRLGARVCLSPAEEEELERAAEEMLNDIQRLYDNQGG